MYKSSDFKCLNMIFFDGYVKQKFDRLIMKFQACLNQGMRTSWVLTESEKKERMERKVLKKAGSAGSKVGVPGLQITSSQNSQNQKGITDSRLTLEVISGLQKTSFEIQYFHYITVNYRFSGKTVRPLNSTKCSY